VPNRPCGQAEVGPTLTSGIGLKELLPHVHMRWIMTGNFRTGAIALTFLASIGVANAQDNAPGNAMSPTSKGQPEGQKQKPQLSPAQKQMIFTLIRRTRVHVKPPPGNILVAIGAQVPSSTELYSLPDAAAAKVPAARPYDYTIVQDTLVLVDPVSRQIVATERQ
jgi:hypothetical protein